MGVVAAALLLAALGACGSNQGSKASKSKSCPSGMSYDKKQQACIPSESVTAAPWSTPTTPAPADARADPFIFGTASPPLPPGDPGVVSVVAAGPPPSASVTGSGPQCMAMVVRNNTRTAMANANVTATAKSPSGQLVGAADTRAHGLLPVRIAPGQIGSDLRVSTSNSHPTLSSRTTSRRARGEVPSRFA
jgi:hypothetical protein